MTKVHAGDQIDGGVVADGFPGFLQIVVEPPYAGKIGTRFGGPKSVRATMTPDKSRQLQQPSQPRLLGGQSVADDNGADIRRSLADWITSKDNPYFARNFANRYWAWLTGRGLVEPVDDLRATNPASIPALLDALTEDFVVHNFDVRHLLRTICNSRVYQLASNLNPQRDHDGALFTHRVPRRLQAEVLLDALNDFAGTTESFTGQPPGTRAIALPDPTIGSYFLTTFGRATRQTVCSCEVKMEPNLSQALHLLNGDTVQSKIEGGNLIGQRLEEGKSADEILDELYLRCLTRKPNTEEAAKFKELLAQAEDQKVFLEDTFWALLNSREFLFNH